MAITHLQLPQVMAPLDQGSFFGQATVSLSLAAASRTVQNTLLYGGMKPVRSRRNSKKRSVWVTESVYRFSCLGQLEGVSKCHTVCCIAIWSPQWISFSTWVQDRMIGIFSQLDALSAVWPLGPELIVEMVINYQDIACLCISILVLIL